MAGVEPGYTFIEGLDLSRQTYSTAGQKVEKDVTSAHEIIKEKLPVLSQLKALVSLTLGDRPPLFIDARGSEAKLLDSSADEPDTKITIKPEYISQFYEGKLEPRYGLFKDAFFHEASMPKGNILAAIKFADLLTPNSPVPPKKVVPGAFPRLPQPTTDIEQVKRDIQELGYGLLKYALIHSQIQILKKTVQEQAAADGGPNAPNQRIWTLVNKGEEFLDLLNHPLIDELVPWFLGEHALIHSYSANIARPGNVPMQLHTDQVAIQPPIRDMAFGMNIMWYLEDITDANGGTRVFPGSHLGQVAPEDLFTVEGTVAAEGPAGTALVFDNRLWHATGPNREASGERPVILMFFMRAFIRQQENNFLSLRKGVEAKLSDRIKRMLGFYTTGALGGIEGEVREGIFVSRKDDCIGKLRAPHEE
ncbi:phytanoyl-dioxygenase [Colletotrichum sojae]|uniref:Phytanoyl-dioxygenase n=1 Tax=Colletotrichum sojae TaxID=2175907 RepID=A0A8H6J914_9PEZI|nr:phytanoyl-dioxygenase [Colletotrichum sojae]